MLNSTPVIKLNSKRVLITLIAITLFLVCLSVWGQYLKYVPDVMDMHGAVQEFGVDLLMQSFYTDTESSVPTYFNIIILFIPAMLFAAISVWKFSVKDKFRFQWLGLALIFLYLSIDEAAVIHEKLIKPMRALVDFEGYGGLFYFAWIIPGIAIVLLFMIAYFRFFMHLDTKYKILFFASLAVYVSGIIGGEMLSGHFAETIGQKNLTYAIYTSLEESLEWTGCSLIIYSLLAYLEQYLPEGFTVKA